MLRKDYWPWSWPGPLKLAWPPNLRYSIGSKRYQCILLCTISSFLRRSHNHMSQDYWYTLRFPDSHSMMWDTRRDLRKNQQYHWYQRIQYYNYKKRILRLTMVQKWLKNLLRAIVQFYRVHPEFNLPRISIRYPREKNSPSGSIRFNGLTYRETDILNLPIDACCVFITVVSSSGTFVNINASSRSISLKPIFTCLNTFSNDTWKMHFLWKMHDRHF